MEEIKIKITQLQIFLKSGDFIWSNSSIMWQTKFYPHTKQELQL
jgi:hypothetical protein